MRRFILFCLTFFLSCFSVSGALAHGDKPSFEKEVGSYLVDIGYSTLGFRPDEEVTFDFDLFLNTDTPAFEPFDSIRVAVKRGDETIFSEEVQNQKNFVPSVTYAFPKEGSYTLQAQYVRDNSIIADASFTIAVTPTSGTVARIKNILTYIAAAGLTLFAFGYIIWSYRQRRA